MKEVGRVLLGSYNYELAGPSSDKDYKLFMCPDFNDLYRAHKASKGDLPAETVENGELSVLDVRKLDSLVREGNVNVTEYLFSSERFLDRHFAVYWDQAQKLYEDGYLAVVWNKWFSSLEGLVKNSYERYGSNKKNTSRAYYFFALAKAVLDNNFKMDYSTWRGYNEQMKYARKLRFDENENFPFSLEEFYDKLSALKKMGNELAENFNHEEKETLQQRAEDLGMAMQDFVWEEVYYGLTDNFYFNY